MHLKYLHTSKFFTWEELSCLTSALGYPNGTLRKCIPEDTMIRKDGVSYREILKLIDLKFFNEALHLSVNMHTADYNINVLRKSMNLLNHKFLTFDELSDVRVAFEVYEAGDIKGMIIDKHTLMRTLKLCGRTIAPMKLMHRVKHMEERLDEPGRIQFYEFLDLIVLCSLTKEIAVPDSKRGTMDKTWRHLFELDDLERLFATQDEKLETHLNKQFVGTERNYGHEILGSKRIPRESSVDPTLRKAQVRYHSRRYRELKGSLTKSTGHVQNTKAGHVRARPVSAPDVEQFLIPSTPPIFNQLPMAVQESLSPVISTPTSSRPISARSSSRKSDLESVRNVDPRLRLLQTIHDRKTVRSAPSGSSSEGLRFKIPASMMQQGEGQPPSQGWGGGAGGDLERIRRGKPKAKPLRRREIRTVVSAGDMNDRQHILDSLQYEIETLEERTMQSLHSQLKNLLPHHTFKSIDVKQREAHEIERARAVKLEEERLRRQRKREAKKKAAESLEQLVHPNIRVFHTLHDRNCDSHRQAFVASRHSGDQKSQQTKPTPKPLVLLDGQKLMSASEQSIRLEKTTIDSSTGSIDDAASSVAQTTDIGHHAGILMHPRHSRTMSHTPYDPTKFRASRMGTAAVLHSYFHDTETASEFVDEGIETMPASEIRGESHDTGIKTDEPAKDEKGTKADKEKDDAESEQRKSSLHSDEGKSKSRKPSRKFRSPAAQNLQFERTKLTRKVQIGEEEELWLHGFPLSEIDRLTFKSGEERVESGIPLTESLSDIYSKE